MPVVRDEGTRPEDAHLRAELPQDHAGAAGHPAVLDIADDGDPAAGQRPQHLLHGEGIQQALGGMRMMPIAGVDDTGLGVFGNQVGHASRRMPHDDVIHLHGLQGIDGVDDTLALHHRGGGDGEIGHIGAEAFGGDFEGGPGARAGFVKKRQDVPSPQRRHLLHRLPDQVFEGQRGLEEEIDLLHAERFDIEQVFASFHDASCLLSTRKSPSCPSCSRRRTLR